MQRTSQELRQVTEELKLALKAYEDRPNITFTGSDSNDPEHALTRFLLWYMTPTLAAAGLLDWYWHKVTDIEHTAGTRESLIHLMMNLELGTPILMGLFLEINAGVLAAMFAAFALHELTVFWDVGYALNHREVKPLEQCTHSFLEVPPFMVLAMASCLYSSELPGIFGKGRVKHHFRFKLKDRKLSNGHLAALAAMILGGVAIPYGNELWRCWNARKERHYNAGCYEHGKPRSTPTSTA
ncbi:MAG: hypothetical protein ACXVAM_08160 [Vulcanimicrobiaceae bacterium]